MPPFNSALECLQLINLRGQRKKCFQILTVFETKDNEENRRYYNSLLRKYYELHPDYQELADNQFINERGLYEFLKFIYFSSQHIYKTPKNPHPSNPQLPPTLTFTQYYYGIITLTTKSANNYHGSDKQTKEEAIDYLTKCYNRYFADSSNIKTKDFDCNFWIEEILSTSYIHAHIFYRRKKGYLFAGKNWLKLNTTFTCNIQNKYANTDDHIRRLLNYTYSDADSQLITEFPKQFNELK